MDMLVLECTEVAVAAEGNCSVLSTSTVTVIEDSIASDLTVLTVGSSKLAVVGRFIEAVDFPGPEVETYFSVAEGKANGDVLTVLALGDKAEEGGELVLSTTTSILTEDLAVSEMVDTKGTDVRFVRVVNTKFETRVVCCIG